MLQRLPHDLYRTPLKCHISQLKAIKPIMQTHSHNYTNNTLTIGMFKARIQASMILYTFGEKVIDNSKKETLNESSEVVQITSISH